MSKTLQTLRKTSQTLYEGFPKAKTAIIVAVALLYGALTLLSGGSLWQLLWFACVVALWLVLPGLLLTKLLRTERFMPGFRGPLAILLGTGCFAVVYCFAQRLGLRWLLLAAGPVLSTLGAGWWLYARRKRPAPRPFPRPARANGENVAHTGAGPDGAGQECVRYVFGICSKPQAHQWMLMLLFAALLLLYTFAGVVKNARPGAVGDILLNQDMLWNVGNAASFKIAFPPQDIRFYDVRLHYHYLTELVSGALSIVSGIPAYNVVAFYLQPYTLAAMVLCLFRFGRMLWPKSMFKSLLFPYSLFLFACASLWKSLPNGLSVFWNGNIPHLVTNINSQTTATVFLCIFLGLFVAAARQKYRMSVWHTLLLLASFVLLCFAKGPYAALVAVGLVLALLVGLFQKHTGVRGLLLGAVIAGLFLFIYLTMFSSGASTSMPFSPTKTLEQGYFGNILNLLWHKNTYMYLAAIPVLWVAQSFLMTPAAFPLYLRAVWDDVRRFTKLSPPRLLFHAVTVGGLAAYFLFSHPAMSQAYFLYAAIFFMLILAVDKVDLLRCPAEGAAQRHKGLQKAFVAVCAFFAAVGFATAGFLYVNMLGSGARQLARNTGLMAKYPYELVVTPEDEQAMLWLQDNTGTDVMFATNRIHTGGRKEGISNLYSAFSERQGFMEGFQYAVTNMGVPMFEVERRLAVNNALFAPGTPPEEILRLCRENGIDYLVYCAQEDGADSQLAFLELVYDSQPVRIYKVPAA